MIAKTVTAAVATAILAGTGVAVAGPAFAQAQYPSPGDSSPKNCVHNGVEYTSGSYRQIYVRNKKGELQGVGFAVCKNGKWTVYR